MNATRPEDTTMLRALVRGLHAFMVLGAVLATVGAVVTAATEWRRYVGAILVLVVVAWSHWQSRSDLRRSVAIIVSGIWCMTTVTALLLAGIHSASNILYPFCIGLAGWILGGRWLIGMVAATVAVFAGMAIAETYGVLVPSARAKPFLVVAQTSAILMAVAYMAWAARRVLADSRDRAEAAATAIEAQNEALEQSRQETERLMNNMPAAVASFDAQSRLLRCNQRYADLFAAQSAELVGQFIDDYVPAVVLDQLRQYWNMALAGTPQNYRRFNLDPRTQFVTWVDVALMPVVQQDQVVGLDAVLMDVTEKVQAEAKLKSLNADLEHQVEVRTRDLLAARERLEESHDELLRSQGATSLVAMVAGVAHELGTPVGNARLAAGSSKDLIRELTGKFESGRMTRGDMSMLLATLQEGERILESNLTRAEELLQSFRQLSADQASEQRRQFDLADTVEEVVGSMSPMLRRRPHRIVVEVPTGITMDSLPGPLGQVLINLINNAYLHAFDRMEQGTLTVRAYAQGAQKVRIDVEDDGCGMDAEVLERLFEPFFSTRIGSGGTGLGMGIVRRIVQRTLGGQIRVQSEPGKGTRFAIELPVQAPTITQ